MAGRVASAELRPRAGLSDEERAAVGALAARTARHDGTALEFHLDPPDPGHEGETQQVLAYAGGRLVGFVGLVGRREVEVSGVVAPDYRRRGIGRRLFEAARAELARRRLAGGLLVCDEAAPAGTAFALAAGCTYDFAEHRLRLDPARVPALPSSPLRLRPANAEDVPTMAAISAAAFREVEADVRRWMGEDLRHSDRRWFHATLDGTAIGNLRLVEAEGAVYVTGFGVAPIHQGRGYGRHILLRIIHQLLADGRQPIMIEVETDNRNALALYLACGFVPEHTYRYFQIAV